MLIRLIAVIILQYELKSLCYTAETNVYVNYILIKKKFKKGKKQFLLTHLFSWGKKVIFWSPTVGPPCANGQPPTPSHAQDKNGKVLSLSASTVGMRTAKSVRRE